MQRRLAPVAAAGRDAVRFRESRRSSSDPRARCRPCDGALRAQRDLPAQLQCLEAEGRDRMRDRHHFSRCRKARPARRARIRGGRAILADARVFVLGTKCTVIRMAVRPTPQSAAALRQASAPVTARDAAAGRGAGDRPNRRSAASIRSAVVMRARTMSAFATRAEEPPAEGSGNDKPRPQPDQHIVQTQTQTVTPAPPESSARLSPRAGCASRVAFRLLPRRNRRAA